MNPKELLQRYAKSRADFERVYEHSQRVREIALGVAEKFQRRKNLKLDMELIEKGSLLHDIGVLVLGGKPYIQHGVLGAEILRQEDLPEKYARICENHVGVGITKEDIEQAHLPLPQKDFLPQSWEEKIIAYADKWHSKSKGTDELKEIINEFKKYGEEKAEKFLKWHRMFK